MQKKKSDKEHHNAVYFSPRPNLYACTILRWLWGHLCPSCSLMKNSSASYKGQKRLPLLQPQPCPVHLEKFTLAEQLLDYREKRQKQRLWKKLCCVCVCVPLLPIFSACLLIFEGGGVFTKVLISRDDPVIIWMLLH